LARIIKSIHGLFVLFSSVALCSLRVPKKDDRGAESGDDFMIVQSRL